MQFCFKEKSLFVDCKNAKVAVISFTVKNYFMKIDFFQMEAKSSKVLVLRSELNNIRLVRKKMENSLKFLNVVKFTQIKIVFKIDLNINNLWKKKILNSQHVFLLNNLKLFFMKQNLVVLSETYD